VVRCLLQHGADVAAVNQFGNTALHWAVAGG
jgi:ankyrin repeat protein